MKPLIQELKIDLKNRLVGSICPSTSIDPKTGEQKSCTKNISPSFLNSFKDEKNKIDSHSITTHLATYLDLLANLNLQKLSSPKRDW